MKTVLLLVLSVFLIATGCENPSATGNDSKQEEKARFSTHGVMVLGNILVAELGKSLYKLKDEDNDSTEEQPGDKGSNTEKSLKNNPKEEKHILFNQI